MVFLSSLGAQSASERLLSFLSILSLLATAYTMRSAPLYPDRKGKKPLTPQNERLEMIHSALIPVNGVVCVLLTLIYMIFLNGDSWYINPVFYLIPGGKSFTFISKRMVYHVQRWLILIPCSHAGGHRPCESYYAFGRSGSS